MLTSAASASSWLSDNATVSCGTYTTWKDTASIATSLTSMTDPSFEIDEDVTKIRCNDGEIRLLRDYVLWVLNGCKKKVKLMKAPEVAQADMLI